MEGQEELAGEGYKEEETVEERNPELEGKAGNSHDSYPKGGKKDVKDIGEIGITECVFLQALDGISRGE